MDSDFERVWRESNEEIIARNMTISLDKTMGIVYNVYNEKVNL